MDKANLGLVGPDLAGVLPIIVPVISAEVLRPGLGGGKPSFSRQSWIGLSPTVRKLTAVVDEGRQKT